jgi:hypothetical protein
MEATHAVFLPGEGSMAPRKHLVSVLLYLYQYGSGGYTAVCSSSPEKRIIAGGCLAACQDKADSDACQRSCCRTRASYAPDLEDLPMTIVAPSRLCGNCSQRCIADTSHGVPAYSGKLNTPRERLGSLGVVVGRDSERQSDQWSRIDMLHSRYRLLLGVWWWCAGAVTGGGVMLLLTQSAMQQLTKQHAPLPYAEYLLGVILRAIQCSNNLVVRGILGQRQSKAGLVEAYLAARSLSSTTAFELALMLVTSRGGSYAQSLNG